MTDQPARVVERYSDEALMDRYFELARQPEKHAQELAAIDAAIQARLLATYGAESGSS